MRGLCIFVILALAIAATRQSAQCQEAASRPTLGFSEAADEPDTQQELDLLWQLTLQSNPLLREAQADVDAARGEALQAGKYPNPRFLYMQDTIGSRIAVQGNQSLMIAQEFVTAGKRRLDV